MMCLASLRVAVSDQHRFEDKEEWTLDDNRSSVKFGQELTGKVVGYLHRSEDGAVVMGTLYPEGEYDLVEVTTRGDPQGLLGGVITEEVVGYFHGDYEGYVKYHVPKDAGTYGLIQNGRTD